MVSPSGGAPAVLFIATNPPAADSLIGRNFAPMRFSRYGIIDRM